MLSRQTRQLSTLTSLCVTLSLFGYVFALSVFSTVAAGDAGTSIISIPYRILMLLYCCYILWRTRKEKVRIPVEIGLIFIYWAILIARFIDDVYFKEIQYNPGEVFRMFSYIFGIDLPTLLVAIRGFRLIDFHKLYKQSFWVVFVSCVCIVLFNSQQFSDSIQIFNNGRVETAGLNPITLGHLGASLVILALYLRNPLTPKAYKILKWIAIILGLYITIKAASRGPVLLLGLLLCIYAYFRYKKLAIFGVTIIILVVAFWPIISDFVLNEIVQNLAPALYARAVETAEHGDPARAALINEAVNLFFNSPIIGSQFSLIQSGHFFYAHNVLLDALVAGGIIGLLIFTIPLLRSYWAAFKLLNTPVQFFVLLALKIMLTIFMSGSFFFDNATGVCMSILLLLYYQKYHGWNKSPFGLSLYKSWKRYGQVTKSHGLPELRSLNS